jgi:hypothetical protein
MLYKLGLKRNRTNLLAADNDRDLERKLALELLNSGGQTLARGAALSVVLLIACQRLVPTQ